MEGSEKQVWGWKLLTNTTASFLVPYSRPFDSIKTHKLPIVLGTTMLCDFFILILDQSSNNKLIPTVPGSLPQNEKYSLPCLNEGLFSQTSPLALGSLDCGGFLLPATPTSCYLFVAFCIRVPMQIIAWSLCPTDSKSCTVLFPQ